MTAVANILRLNFERKKKVRGYSLRALARDVGVSPAFISNVFSGKKRLPKTLVEPICRILDIDHETTLGIRAQIEMFDDPKVVIKDSPTWVPGEKRQLSILRNWYYPAILELISCQGINPTPQVLADRLSISVTAAEIALRELESLDLITLENGVAQKSTRLLRLSSASSYDEIRSFHKEMLKKASNELLKTTDTDVEQRLITGITVTASPEKIMTAKKMLSEALHEIANYLTEEQGTEVYHLAAQLFPLTKKN